MINKQLAVRKRRICYVNSDSKTLETSVAFFEKRLKLISKLEIEEFSSFEIMKASGPCDLLIINASNLDDKAFFQWFSKIESKIPNPLSLPVPTLFFSRIDFDTLETLWESAYKNNWYFDILHPQHMDSLPIRIANLLRIYDHLHEIQRYENELMKMKTRLLSLEEKIEKLVR